MIEINNYNDLVEEFQKSNSSLIEYIKCKVDCLYNNYEKNDESFRNIGIKKILICKRNNDKILINDMIEKNEWIDEIMINNEFYLNICVKEEEDVVTEIYAYCN